MEFIGQGLQGSVFRISADRCVKIYHKREFAEQEYNAYQRMQGASFVPRIYESGTNHLVMEYLPGPTLQDFLRTIGYLPEETTQRVLTILREMKRFGFTRIDVALFHILEDKSHQSKVIDHVHSFTSNYTTPYVLFENLSELGMLTDFKRQVKMLDTDFYDAWAHAL